MTKKEADARQRFTDIVREHRAATVDYHAAIPGGRRGRLSERCGVVGSADIMTDPHADNLTEKGLRR